MTKSGCFLSLKLSPPTYEARCSQKTPRKNSLKESNISMKKYHQSPTFGVRSGNRRCTPYVDAMNSHDPPVIRYDMYNRIPMAIKKKTTFERPNPIAFGGVFVRLAARS